MPDCPKCGSPMVLRTARRGRNAGNSFWGCSDYPNCSGTRATEEDQEPVEGPARPLDLTYDSTTESPVTWSDRVGRQGWIAEYISIGSLPGIAKKDLDPPDDSLSRVLSQSYLLTSRSRDRALSEDARLISSVIQKILQRGRVPLPTLGIEKAALKNNDMWDWVTELPDSSPELGVELARTYQGSFSKTLAIQVMTERQPFLLDDEFSLGVDREVPLFDSEHEVKFYTDWLPKTFGPHAPNWFVPQASLDQLLEAHGESDTGDRRVDFLFVFPNVQPLAIEIDGPEHEDNNSVDRERDDLLTSCGVRVIRIKNSEIQDERGPGLDVVSQHCRHHLVSTPQLAPAESNLARILKDCTVGSKVQFSIAKGIQFGWLKPNTSWRIQIDGADTVAFAAVEDVVSMVYFLDQIYGTSIAPQFVEIHCGQGSKTLAMSNTGTFDEVDQFDGDEVSALHVFMDNDNSPFHVVTGESSASSPDILIRPAYLPAPLAVESIFPNRRPSIERVQTERIKPALEIFLRQIFRKSSFRNLQAESIVNPLIGNDCIVLLPTGAGKSIIYQLAGLLMPGVTLVVDPLISLIEDQVDGLQQYGIDRAVAISSAVATPEESRRLLNGVQKGEFQFVLISPERLQNPSFRGTLRSLAQISTINLAVIDEAHCVSEWGHDFRPAYLNLSRNLRTFAKDADGIPPPIIALTGTASRSVLRDVLTELNIDRNNSDSLIRPDSFDRQELQFDIRTSERVQEARATLEGILNGLPEQFGMPRGEFYRQAGRDTSSGIVFVPTVRGASHGVVSTVAAVRATTNANVTIYSGKSPNGAQNRREWDEEKRKNARQFKSNVAPILVSTKAFGMGIDKPNIRYTIHFGMPASLEAFYQEAGRAGRDRRPAKCLVVFTEFDPNRTDTLLDPALDLNDVRRLNNELADNRNQDDDVTRALYFHLNSFNGQEEEVQEVGAVLEAVGELTRADTFDLTFSPNGKEKQEKALYRLTKIGAFDDYEVIFGSKLFRIYYSSFDIDRCKANLLAYVHSAQPGRIKVFAEQLDAISEGDAKALALKLARLFVDFTYDVIERSRRRSIQEAVLLARTARTDHEIRQRLLNYLQEGVGSERIEALLEETEVSLKDWTDMFENISSPMDAGEIRGLSIRSLESFPDHPGLLMTRGVAEMMCSNADDTVSSQVLHSAFVNSMTRYAINEEEVGESFEWLVEMCSGKAPSLGLPLAVAFFDAARDKALSDELNSRGETLLGSLQDERVRTVLESRNFVDSCEKLTSSLKVMVEVLKDPELRLAVED